MSLKVKEQRSKILETLRRLRVEFGDDSEFHNERRNQLKEEYDLEILKYKSMRDGGDGGQFRNTENTIRSLHFSGWKDSDFQLLLESAGEEPRLSDDEWQEKFSHETSFFKGLFGKKGRPE